MAISAGIFLREEASPPETGHDLICGNAQARLRRARRICFSISTSAKKTQPQSHDHQSIHERHAFGAEEPLHERQKVMANCATVTEMTQAQIPSFRAARSRQVSDVP